MNPSFPSRIYFPFKRLFSSVAKFKKAKKEVPIEAVTAENQYEFLSDVVTPFWKLDYVEQLLRKKRWCREVVAKIKSYPIPGTKTIVHNVCPSPNTESYRNKDEFSVRTGVDGNEKTVGFFLSSPAKGKTLCVPGTKLINLKEDHVRLAEIYQDLIRSSPLKACHDLHDGGFWRNLMVRSNSKGEIMAVVVVHPSGSTEKILNETKILVRDYFLQRYPDIYSLSLQVCPHTRCTGEVAPFILLHGQEYLYETLNGFQVRISPDSFFQINTEAASVLYEAALNLLEIDDRTTFLDLCCGIGCCSFIASKSVRGCVGIETISHAIEDAKFNAQFNEIKNCEFITGRIEKELVHLFTNIEGASDIVPFLNPGRAGVNRDVIKILRRNQSISRLAYVSCKADGPGAMKNFVELCSKGLDYSQPFRLTDVQAVDMFPQTQQCDLILIFRR